MRLLNFVVCFMVSLSLLQPLWSVEEGAIEAAQMEQAVEQAVTATLAAKSFEPPIVLENDFCQVEIERERGLVQRLVLKTAKTIRLPAWISEEQSSKERLDLAVLGPFHRSERDAGHNWVYGVWLPQDENGQLIPWTVVEQTNDRLKLIHAYTNEKNGSYEYELEFFLQEARSTLVSTLRIRNVGTGAGEQRPHVVPINGLHQDFPITENYYNNVLTLNPDGEFTAQDLPDYVGGAPTPPSQLAANDILVSRSRYFAALWQPLSFTRAKFSEEEIAESKTEAAPGPSAGPSAGPQSGSEGPVLAQGFAEPVNYTLQGYRSGQGYMEAQQILVNAHWGNNGGRIDIAPGEEIVMSWQTTVTGLAGADLERLTDAEKEIEYTDWYYRFFRSLTGIMTWLLNLLYGIFAAIGLDAVGYGLAVLSLTFIIKALMHKLTVKQQRSMLMMQKVAPEMRALQEQYKNDRQALAQKQMELWKKHGVNPMSGCLPIFIQMPIFIALYQAFSQSADLRGQSFLWIKDLTLPDYVWYLHFNWPFFGGPATINILPIIYIAASLVMSLMHKPTMPATQNPDMPDMTKMMRWMPVIFGVIFYNMPAGLVLYFTANIVITAAELYYVRKKLGII